ncbi:MAG: hypothetical protein ABI874_12775 [Chloroflexota bacterium]
MAADRFVVRVSSERYMRFVLLGFAASVTLTRVYLQMTGYPKLGSGDLHIAHMLWGGLLLFAALLLVLLFTTRNALTVASVAGGVGVGLFIDEVGKFITATNDYFYPPAAPIIYVIFLLTVFLYLQVRRLQRQTPREEMYAALELMAEVLEHDLEPHEQADMIHRLQFVAAQSERPDLARLASVLLDYLHSDALSLVERPPTFAQRITQRVYAWQERWLKRPQFKTLLICGLCLTALPALVDGAVLFVAASSGINTQDALVARLSALGLLKSPNDLVWLLALTGADGLLSILLLVAAILLFIGKEARGILLTQVSLLAALTAVNVLVFYFDQFQAIAVALIQYLLLNGAVRYRRRYLAPQTAKALPPRAAA